MKEIKCNKQVNEIRKKAYFSLHKVRKISSLLNDDCKNLPLNALVLPRINYCCSVSCKHKKN